MLMKIFTKLTKIVGALAAIAVGVWAYASESNRPLVTDVVTNTRLIEIYAPSDGELTHVLLEGSQFHSGEELAQTTRIEPSEVVLIEDLDVGTNYDVAVTDDNTEYSNTSPFASQRNDTVAFEMLDLLSNEKVRFSTNVDRQPMRSNESALLSQASGIIWHWRDSSDAYFASGDHVGYVAECQNLIAVGQAPSSQTLEMRVGDPVLFVTKDLEWEGVIQRIVAGMPNMAGQYAIQFPVIAPNSSLLFFALDVPAENRDDCALGVPGQIHYPQSARPRPYETSVAVMADAKRIANQIWDRVRTSTRSVFSSL